MVWQAIGATVRGASHQRDGRPNQDALGLPPTRTGPPLVLAIADGHGSARYTRSDRGSRFAVEVAQEILAQGFGEPAGAAGLSRIKREATELLPRRLHAAWQQRVDADLAAAPLTPEELAVLTGPASATGSADSDEPGTASPSSPANAPLETGEPGPVELSPQQARIPYGSTLLAAVMTAEYLLYLQLGDGDILAVDAHGTVHHPLPDDDRLFANETTSLCSDQAWKDFRVGFQVLDPDAPGDAPEGGPVLVMLSTDGLANSYRTAADFEKFAGDMLDIIRDKGLARTELDLPAWLTDATTTGSGDDITVALARREEPFDADATARQREQLQQTVRALGQQTSALDATVTAIRAERDDLRETVRQQAARLREQDVRLAHLDRRFGSVHWHRPAILLLALVTLFLAVYDGGKFIVERQQRLSSPKVLDAAAATLAPDRIDIPAPATPSASSDTVQAAGTADGHAMPSPALPAADTSATQPETRDHEAAAVPRLAPSSATATRDKGAPAGPGPGRAARRQAPPTTDAVPVPGPAAPVQASPTTDAGPVPGRATRRQAPPTTDSRATRNTKGQTDGGTSP